MSLFKSTYSYKIYRNFQAIDVLDFRAIISFYTHNKSEIKHLEFDAYFEILIAYTNALFHIGHYERFVSLVQLPLELIIEHNVLFYQGEDIYNELLFKKAAAHYNIGELNHAQKTLESLIKIDPFHSLSLQFYQKCKLMMKPQIIETLRAVSVLLFILSALVIAIEVLSIRNFYPEFIDSVTIFRNGLFLMGLFILLGSEVGHRMYIYLSLDEIRKKAIAAKKAKSVL